MGAGRASGVLEGSGCDLFLMLGFWENGCLLSFSKLDLNFALHAFCLCYVYI